MKVSIKYYIKWLKELDMYQLPKIRVQLLKLRIMYFIYIRIIVDLILQIEVIILKIILK
jgi:hypothetical protein